MTPTPIPTVILGASGYTGAELLRLLHHHPYVKIAALTADSQAGQPIEESFPHLHGLALPPLVKIEEVDFNGVQLVFCCLPHGTTQEIIAALPGHVRIVDLSADFRLFNPALYAEWYGHEHRAPQLQRSAVYGLSEYVREAIASARLVANPGCYPTVSLLPLLPLLQEGMICPDPIIIDAKSGVTGAGRSMKRNLLFCEIEGGFSAYGVGQHRHRPEIEQVLSWAAERPVEVHFTPHLVPMKRGMLATIYVRLNGYTLQQARAYLERAYRAEPFVTILPEGAYPQTQHVTGTNTCRINLFAGRRPEDAILVSAIDNLVKGASGQAVQNMNLMFGFDETTGLRHVPVFP